MAIYGTRAGSSFDDGMKKGLKEESCKLIGIKCEFY